MEIRLKDRGVPSACLLSKGLLFHSLQLNGISRVIYRRALHAMLRTYENIYMYVSRFEQFMKPGKVCKTKNTQWLFGAN